MAPAYDRPPRAPGALPRAARRLAVADSWATAAGRWSWRARLYRDADPRHPRPPRLCANRLPLLVCGISVAAGVALATSGLVLTDAMRAGLVASGELSARHLDVAVRQRSVLRTPAGEVRGRLPASTTGAVQAVAGVAGADPVVEGYVDVAVDGRAVTEPGRGLVGRARSWASDPTLNPWRLVEGQAPRVGSTWCSIGPAPGGRASRWVGPSPW